MENISFINAKAIVKGGNKFPQINGEVYFRQTAKGVIVTARINNLPHSNAECQHGRMGFHIHSGNSGNKIACGKIQRIEMKY